MYPLKFLPILKERLWGGTKLKDVLGKPIENDITGESWELSTVKGDVSVIANGNLVGTSLQELINKNPEEFLGKGVVDRFGKDFPMDAVLRTILFGSGPASKEKEEQGHPIQGT